MLEILKNEKLSVDLWELFLKNKNGSFLQSSLWSDLKSEFGWSSERILILKDKEPICGAQIFFKNFYNFLKIAYIPRGPVGDENLEILIKEIIKMVKEKRVDFLKIEPPWENNENFLKFFNFKKGKDIQVRTTVILDISSDDISKILNKKIRYEIRKAKESGIRVKYGSLNNLDNFYFILKSTAKNKKFKIRPINYYRKFLEIFKENALLIFAEYNFKLIGSILVLRWNDTIYYLYGGSLQEYKFLPISYVLQEEAILWGKSFGCKKYDLWGISENLPGVSRFKKNFGGEILDFIGAWDLPFSKIKHLIFNLLYHARNI